MSVYLSVFLSTLTPSVYLLWLFIFFYFSSSSSHGEGGEDEGRLMCINKASEQREQII